MAGFRDINPENPFYDDPSTRKTSIGPERRAEKNIIPFDKYGKYANRPYSEVCTEIPGSTRLFWEDCAREIAYSSRLLPENPEALADKYPVDAAHIVRTKFLGKENPSTWLFNGNYSKDNYAVKFIIKEIDLTKIHGTDWFTPQRTFITELVKDLYMLFYFSHENLQQALFCRTEPELFRMNIALPRTIPLLEVSQKFALRYRYSEIVCSSMQFVPICILRALAYLHDCNITHNDVSISNCVVAGNGHIMLGGFQKSDCKQRKKSRRDGALAVFNNKRGPECALNDIWNVGTLTLDYLFGTAHFGKDFPNPTCIKGFEHLFQMMENNPPINNENGSDDDSGLESYRRLIYGKERLDAIIEAVGGMDSYLYEFIEFIFQACARPNAKWLLEECEFSAIRDAKFDAFRGQFIEKCLNNGFEFKQLFNERKLTNRFQAINTRRIRNALKSESKSWEEETACSKYQCNIVIKSPERKFQNGSEIKVAFILHSKLHDEPIRYDGQFKAGIEQSVLELCLELLKLRRPTSCNMLPEAKSFYWKAVNMSDTIYEPWDIFRIRTALNTMLLETAEDAYGGGHTDILDGENLFTRRDFALCDHPNKLSRKVVIEMECSRNDLIICPYALAKKGTK